MSSTAVVAISSPIFPPASTSSSVLSPVIILHFHHHCHPLLKKKNHHCHPGSHHHHPHPCFPRHNLRFSHHVVIHIIIFIAFIIVNFFLSFFILVIFLSIVYIVIIVFIIIILFIILVSFLTINFVLVLFSFSFASSFTAVLPTSSLLSFNEHEAVIFHLSIGCTLVAIHSCRTPREGSQQPELIPILGIQGICSHRLFFLTLVYPIVFRLPLITEQHPCILPGIDRWHPG